MQTKHQAEKACISPVSRTDKKHYGRPELTRHGKIESLTHPIPVQGGCSSPLKVVE
jgi:hypothetical protein